MRRHHLRLHVQAAVLPTATAALTAACGGHGAYGARGTAETP